MQNASHMKVLGVLLSLVLAAVPALALAPPPAEVPEDLPPYVIGPEDVLQVAVWNNEAMTRTIPVRPDGMISLPLLNDVPAAGLP